MADNNTILVNEHLVEEMISKLNQGKHSLTNQLETVQKDTYAFCKEIKGAYREDFLSTFVLWEGLIQSTHQAFDVLTQNFLAAASEITDRDKLISYLSELE